MANPEHLAKLHEGAEAWNRWRQENPDVEVDLSQIDLQYTRTHPMDMSGYNLSGANLTGAHLKYVSMPSVDLRRARMSKAVFEFVDMWSADLSAASLVYATGVRVDLSRARLQRAVLSDAGFSAAKFIHADLTETYMTGANLSGSDFTDANLSMADLSDADLRTAKFTRANLKEAVLIRAEMAQARLEEADLSSAAMNHANLTRAQLQRAVLKEADLRGANMRGAHLESGNLVWADLRSANLQFAVLDDCNADRVKLWETQRSDWSIKGIRCSGAYWDKNASELTRYESEEFEQLYSEHARIEFFYQGGVSTFELGTLPAILHHLASTHEGVQLRLKSIEETGGGAKVSITVSDTDAETTEKIKADAARVFQSQLALRDNQITRLQIEKEYLENFVSETLIQKMLTASAPQTIFNAPVYGAALASGEARITIDQTIHDNAALLSLLQRMMERRDELTLPAAADLQLKGELRTASQELQKPNPNPTVVAKSLGVVKDLAMEGLKKAAAKIGEQVISADWQSWLAQLHEFTHHLHL
jgi:uncharacterized protein YjbI with pentapeptide repeats